MARVFSLQVLLLLLFMEDTKAVANKGTRNIAITIEYYTKLIAEDASKFSELNVFVTSMPKGGDLHHHYSGSIYAETYLDWVGRRGFCIYREDNTTLRIKKYTIETAVSGLSDFAKSLCITVDAVRLDNKFYRELLKHWSDIDYANHYHEQPPPDKQFFDTFGYFGPISNSFYNEAFIWLKNNAISENVQYIESMFISGWTLAVQAELNTIVDSLTSKSTDSEINSALQAYYDAVINDANANSTINSYVTLIETSANNISDANFTLRFQSYVSRNNRPSVVFSSLISSFFAAMRSELILGVNIVGPENGIVSMRDYTLHMKMFRFLKHRFPSVKLAMHAGELELGLVPPDGLKYHIREAIEIAGASRIGHGIDIFYEQNAYELLQKMKQRNVTVEAVISSNAFILGIENNAHPLLLYKAHGVPLVIATDDAGISRSTLSNEYLMYCDRYRPTYAELKEIIYNSIRFSFLSDGEIQKQIARLDSRFLDFEAMIADMVEKNNNAIVPTSSGILMQAASQITVLHIFSVLLFITLVCQ